MVLDIKLGVLVRHILFDLWSCACLYTFGAAGFWAIGVKTFNYEGPTTVSPSSNTTRKLDGSLLFIIVPHCNLIQLVIFKTKD